MFLGNRKESERLRDTQFEWLIWVLVSYSDYIKLYETQDSITLASLDAASVISQPLFQASLWVEWWTFGLVWQRPCACLVREPTVSNDHPCLLTLRPSRYLRQQQQQQQLSLCWFFCSPPRLSTVRLASPSHCRQTSFWLLQVRVFKACLFSRNLCCLGIKILRIYFSVFENKLFTFFSDFKKRFYTFLERACQKSLAELSLVLEISRQLCWVMRTLTVDIMHV